MEIKLSNLPSLIFHLKFIMCGCQKKKIPINLLKYGLHISIFYLLLVTYQTLIACLLIYERNHYPFESKKHKKISSNHINAIMLYNVERRVLVNIFLPLLWFFTNRRVEYPIPTNHIRFSLQVGHLLFNRKKIAHGCIMYFLL